MREARVRAELSRAAEGEDRAEPGVRAQSFSHAKGGLRWVGLGCVALRCVALRCAALRCVALRCAEWALGRARLCVSQLGNHTHTRNHSSQPVTHKPVAYTVQYSTCSPGRSRSQPAASGTAALNLYCTLGRGKCGTVLHFTRHTCVGLRPAASASMQVGAEGKVACCSENPKSIKSHTRSGTSPVKFNAESYPRGQHTTFPPWLG